MVTGNCQWCSCVCMSVSVVSPVQATWFTDVPFCSWSKSPVLVVIHSPGLPNSGASSRNISVGGSDVQTKIVVV